MPELDLGNVKGPQGKSAYQSALDAGYSGSEEAFNKAMAKAPDAVLYTAQSLTDTQKTQARGNINAALGGFGLGGEAKLLTANDNLDDIWRAGWYAWDTAPQNAPIVGGTPISYCSMIVLNKGGDYMKTQVVFSSTGSELHRANNGLGWTAWEWVNPPMELGVEYRTTERYLGKPVYVKVVDFGVLPANAKKAVAHGIDNLGYVLDYSGGAGYWAWPSIPWVSDIEFTNTDIEITTNADEGEYATKIILKYFKTTD